MNPTIRGGLVQGMGGWCRTETLADEPFEWPPSWAVEAWCGVQNSVTLGQSLAQEQS